MTTPTQHPTPTNLGVDALLGELLGRLQAEADHLGEGDERDVLARALHLGLADRQHKVLVQDLLGGCFVCLGGGWVGG